MKSITSIEEGERCLIQKIEASKAVSDKMLALGIITDSEVVVFKNDRAVIGLEFKGSRLIINHKEAEKIFVYEQN